MRLGWRIPLPGPFFLSGTIWRSRRPYWYGYMPDGSRCPHHHRRKDTAQACTAREARRARRISERRWNTDG